MSNAELRNDYDRWFIAGAYDVLAGVVFAPVGGLAALREAALGHFAISAGERVLELGCGSGGVTALLRGRGATVTSVDWSAPMLRKAMRRAPGARFERSEITSYEPEPAAFDVVLFSFVLHELAAPDRRRALAVARRALTQGGRLAIVDHAIPERGVVARGMSRLVHAFEPETSRALLRPGRAALEVEQAGFTAGRGISLAEGMAFALLATPV
jgi:ubiquinone/menaquinone biosynthesis C-methylase UbiE